MIQETREGRKADFATQVEKVTEEWFPAANKDEMIETEAYGDRCEMIQGILKSTAQEASN